MRTILCFSLVATILPFGFYSSASAEGCLGSVVGEVDTPDQAYAVAAGQRYVYIADWHSGLRIIDAANLLVPVEISHVDALGLDGDVDWEGDLVFVADWFFGLRVIDVSDPAEPIEVGFFQYPGITATRVVADGLVYLAAEAQGLRIVDVSDPSAPDQVGVLDPDGWRVSDVAVSGDMAYLAVDTRGLSVVKVSDPTMPIEVGSFLTPLARRVQVFGDIAYVLTMEGIYFVNVATPDSPAEVGFFDNLSTEAADIHLEWPFLYVAYYDSPALVLDVSYPSAIEVVGSYSPSDEVLGFDVARGFVFAAERNSGLKILASCGSILLVDGFESGDTSAWSEVVGSAR